MTGRASMNLDHSPNSLPTSKQAFRRKETSGETPLIVLKPKVIPGHVIRILLPAVSYWAILAGWAANALRFFLAPIGHADREFSMFSFFLGLPFSPLVFPFILWIAYELHRCEMGRRKVEIYPDKISYTYGDATSFGEGLMRYTEVVSVDLRKERLQEIWGLGTIDIEVVAGEENQTLTVCDIERPDSTKDFLRFMADLEVS